MKEKLLMLMFFLAISARVSGQSAPLLQVDIPAQTVSVCDATGVTDLTAVFPTLNTTTTYVATPADVTFLPPFPTTGGTLLNANTDDIWSPLVNLPFNFAFFGTFYNQVIVGSNGLISFNVANAGGYCPWAFTASVPSPALPTNSIFGVYQDTNIASPPVVNPAIQNVNYYVLDTGANQAPNRVFVVNFNELPQFSCNAGVGLQTSQIVIHEGTNIIDFYVDDRSCCPGWNSGSGVIGIQNASGTQGYVSPGMQTGCYGVNDTHFQITPTGPSVTTTLQWFQGGIDPINNVNGIPAGATSLGPATTMTGAANENVLTGVGLGIYTAVVTYTYSNGQTVVISDYYEVEPYQILMDNPSDVVICNVGTSAPYTVDIDQTSALVASATPPTAGNYDIKFYESYANAVSYSNFIGSSGPSTPGAYITSGPFPQTIWVRIEDLGGSGCVNYRPFVITDGPQGTFSYASSPYCNTITAPQAITPGAIPLTSGGVFTVLPNTLTIDAATGEITPSTSTAGNYVVTYTIPGTPPCSDFVTTAPVTIVDGPHGTFAYDVLPYCRTVTAAQPITATNLSAGGTFTASPNTLVINSTTGAITPSASPVGIYTVTYTVTSASCPVWTTTAMLEIKDCGCTAVASATSDSICLGSSLTAAITYSTTVGTVTNATVTGTGALPAGVTLALVGGVWTVDGTPTVAGTFPFTIELTDNTGQNCSIASTITVSPSPSIALSSAAGSNNQSLCVGSTLAAPLTFTIADGATGASASNLPPGMTGTLTGSTFTISGSPTGSGTFPYIVTTSGGCSPNATATGTITVSPSPTISLLSGPNVQTVCVNATTGITNITYSVANGATGATGVSLPPGVTAVFSGSTLTVSGTPTTPGIYNYTVSTTGGCGTANLTGTINVDDNVTIALNSAPATNAQSVCINTAITNITYLTTNGATGVNVTGLPTGVTGVFAGSTFTISGTPTVSTPSVYNYTVTTVGGCAVATASGTITVNPAVTIALLSASGSANQTVCINTTPSNIDYTIANGSTSVITTGLPAGMSGTLTGTTYTISGVPTVSSATPFNYTINVVGNCGTTSIGGSITVNPIATIALTSAAGTANQTVCSGGAITPIEYTIADGGTGATVTGLPPGITGSYAGGLFTITGSTTAVGPLFNYTVTTAGGCPSSSLSGTITMSQDVAMALTSATATASQVICIGDPIVNIQYTVTNGATGASASGLPAGLTGTYIPASGVFNITGTPTVDGLFGYTVVGTGACGPNVSLSGSLLINPAATISLTSATGTEAQTPCINTPITNITYQIGNGATSATALNLPAGVIGTFAGTTFTISGTPTVAGVANYTVSTVGGCGVANLTGSIAVNDNVTIALNSAPATNAQSVCINTAITNITYLTTNGATGVNVTGLPTGVTGVFAGNTFTISGTPTVTSPTAFSYTLTTVGGCSVATATGTITVNPDVTIALTSASSTTSQTLCINTPMVNIDYTIANGSTSVTTAGLPAGVTGTLTGTTYTISGTPTVSAATAFAYTINVVGNCGLTSIGGTITVNPLTTVALTSLPGTDNGTACANVSITNIEYTIANGGTGASVSALPTGLTGVYAAGVFTISGSTALTGAFPYTVTTSGGCGIATATGTINIVPDVTVALTSAPGTDSQVLCINTALTNIVYTITNGATSAIVTGLPAGVTGTLAGNTFTISGMPTVASATAFGYTVNIVGVCGTAAIGGTITVNPNATIALTNGSNTQSGCINVAVGAIEYTIANGATGATALTLPPGVTGTLVGNVFTISGTPTVAGTYNYTVTTSGGCAIASLGGTITVRPNVTLTLNAGSNTTQTACINTAIAPISYTIANAGPLGATVTGLPAGVTGTLTGNTFTISGTPTVSSATPFVYTVTTSGGCSSVTLTGTITVNPNVTMVLTSAPASNNQTTCMATAITPVVFTVGNGATSASIVSGGLPPGITGVFSGNTFTISGSATTSGTFNYEVETTGGCSSVTLPGTIVIKQNVTLTLTSPTSTIGQPLCMNTPIVPITYVTGNNPTGVIVAGLPPGVTYNYVAATGLLTISGSGTSSGIFNYTVNTVGGCGAAPQLTGSINLLPEATIALSSAVGTNAQTVCISDPTGFTDIKYLVGSGATGASVVSGTLPSGIQGSFDLATLTFTLTGTPTQSGVFTYTVKTSGGCSFATINGTITVKALPVIDLTQDAFICVDKNGNPITDATLTTGLSAATHSFIWSDGAGVIAGANGSSYLATAPGVYSVKATNIAEGCYSVATTTVITSFGPEVVNATASTYFADEPVVTIVVSPPGDYIYQVDGGAWQDSNQFINLPSGEHNFLVKDRIGCGELPASIVLIDYPKFFTPNNDGYNDTWNIGDLNMLSNQETSKIEIFDRYGKLLKQISPKGSGWDGTVNGYPLPSTDYWFKVYYNEEKVSKTFKAHFSLKR